MAAQYTKKKFGAHDKRRRGTSLVMCGINSIFAIISNFALYFSIVRLQLIFFAINSRLRGTNFIRTTYSELIRFSFLEVWTVLNVALSSPAGYRMFLTLPPPSCTRTRNVRKTTVRPGPGAWTRRSLQATRGTKTTHVTKTCPYLTLSTIVVIGHYNTM